MDLSICLMKQKTQRWLTREEDGVKDTAGENAPTQNWKKKRDTAGESVQWAGARGKYCNLFTVLFYVNLTESFQSVQNIRSHLNVSHWYI